MWVRYNANPDGRNVGDCTIRALSLALGQSWEQTYVELALEGFMMGDMPSANHVWGAYLVPVPLRSGFSLLRHRALHNYHKT